MIYDCFTFLNELDMLELRLTALGPHVDRFVIVEADMTHAGQPREFCFAQHRARYARWDDRIIYVQVTDMPGGANAWVRENYQRNCILRGLEEAQDDDIVLISDCDEIPDVPEVLAQLKDDEPCVLEQKLYYFFVNYRCTKPWRKAVVTRHKHLRISPNDMRTLPSKARLKNVGWHFSYMMDVSKIQEKLAAFAHQEVNKSEINNRDHIQRAVRGQAPLYDQGKKSSSFYWEPLDPKIGEILAQTGIDTDRFVMSEPKGLEALRNTLKRREIL
jgi:beta-1,4-mannosyl-glycoprotein beta-1,4-N-acetylglucosaminyltransferase